MFVRWAMRRQVALGMALGALVLLVLDAVVARSGLGPGAVPKLAGSSLWITSRAAGVTAFLALSLDVAFGLFISTGVADRAIPRARVVEAHRFLSAVTLTLTAVHAGALLGDRFVRFDVLDLLVPFVSEYRPLSVGLGLLAAYLALVIHQSFAWRKRLGAKLWRSLHYASFAAYAAALLHGVFAGTDARGLSGVYLASGSLIGSLLLYRVAIARRRPASARG
jgi:predicted ferric reductase